jgi:trigger factor
VDRPAIDGDHATITINGSRDGEDIAGLQADDYLYEVGSGSIASELDEHLRGSKVGDILSFDAQPADPDEDLVQFRVIVKDVKQKVLPDVTDEWANDVSEFDTVEELRGDLASRITRVRKLQAQMASRDKAAVALADLVHDDPPEAMVNAEMQQRLQDLGMRLSAQGITAEQYLQATGQTQEQLGDELRQLAAQAVKVDLGLRAVADAEAIEATDEELDEEFARVAERLDQDPDKVRQEFERAEQVPAVRSDIRKRKALDWLVEHVELVDEHGQPVDRQALELDELEAQTDDDHDIEVGEIEVDDVEAGDETAEQDPP